MTEAIVAAVRVAWPAEVLDLERREEVRASELGERLADSVSDD
jgi:hypothetical protein